MKAIFQEYEPIDLAKTGPGFYYDNFDMNNLESYLESFPT